MSQFRRTGLVTAAIALLVAGTAQAQQADPKISPDEAEIRAAVVKFVKAYNAHKVDDLVAMFHDDGVLITRDGDEVAGKQAIHDSFAPLAEEGSKAAISVTVDSLRFLTDNVAVENGYSTAYPDGETATSRSRYTVLHVKRDGKWKMQTVRVVEDEVLSAYARLRDLEWLVGEWIDEGADSVVETSCRWSENKSFLLQNFQVVKDGQVVLKGSQRIGWDPQAKQVRSWIFDNQGGFGEGTWIQADDRWVVKAKGVSAEGVTATATRVLMPRGNDAIIWSAVDRTAGNQLLPGLSVTMVRKLRSAE